MFLVSSDYLSCRYSDNWKWVCEISLGSYTLPLEISVVKVLLFGNETDNTSLPSLSIRIVGDFFIPPLSGIQYVNHHDNQSSEEDNKPN